MLLKDRLVQVRTAYRNQSTTDGPFTDKLIEELVALSKDYSISKKSEKKEVLQELQAFLNRAREKNRCLAAAATTTTATATTTTAAERPSNLLQESTVIQSRSQQITLPMDATQESILQYLKMISEEMKNLSGEVHHFKSTLIKIQTGVSQVTESVAQKKGGWWKKEVRKIVTKNFSTVKFLNHVVGGAESVVREANEHFEDNRFTDNKEIKQHAALWKKDIGTMFRAERNKQTSKIRDVLHALHPELNRDMYPKKGMDTDTWTTHVMEELQLNISDTQALQKLSKRVCQACSSTEIVTPEDLWFTFFVLSKYLAALPLDLEGGHTNETEYLELMKGSWIEEDTEEDMEDGEDRRESKRRRTAVDL